MNKENYISDYIITDNGLKRRVLDSKAVNNST